jgi:hypothetical protein
VRDPAPAPRLTKSQIIERVRKNSAARPTS